MNLYGKLAPTFVGLAVFLAISLSACQGAPTQPPTPDVGVFYTQAAATVVLGLTETAAALPTATSTSTFTPPPSPTAVPQDFISDTSSPETTNTPALTVFPTTTPIPVNPETAFGCYNASFVSDVTIQFAPNFKPGDHFTKTWRVKNTGSCDWPRGFNIAFVSGDRFGTDTREIDQKVTAGDFAEISLDMIAPNLSGVVTSNWQLTTATGKPFGPVLQAAITLPASTPLPTATTSSSGCLNSELVADITVPNGTEMQPGQVFTKTWRIRNTGTCSWNRDFMFTFVGGDILAASSTKIQQVVAPGDTIDISLEMTSPAAAGLISSAWQLASDNGQLFGQLFAFSIVVK